MLGRATGVVRATVVALVLVAAQKAALAHSFYPWACCSDQDCWPTGPGEREPDPVFTPRGWRLSDGVIVPFNRARPSPDGRFHVCRRGGNISGALIAPPSEPPCLWVPMGGA